MYLAFPKVVAHGFIASQAGGSRQADGTGMAVNSASWQEELGCTVRRRRLLWSAVSSGRVPGVGSAHLDDRHRFCPTRWNGIVSWPDLGELALLPNQLESIRAFFAADCPAGISLVSKIDCPAPAKEPNRSAHQGSNSLALNLIATS